MDYRQTIQLSLKRITVSDSKVVADISPARFELEENPAVIANQLTKTDFALYATIKPAEFLFQSWNKPHLKFRAPNVLRMVNEFICCHRNVDSFQINRFNYVSLWTASSILWQSTEVSISIER